VWQLGIELERAWLQSYDEPMLGDPSPADFLAALQPLPGDQATPTADERRGWIKDHHPRGVPRAAHVASSGHFAR
jgi:hypothetical protein